MTPREAFEFVKNNPDCDIEKYQEIACQDPCYARWFALQIPGANIGYCQKHACQNPEYAYMFARDIRGANIEYCQKHACKSSVFAYEFSLILEAGIEYCYMASPISKFFGRERVETFILEEL